MVTLYVYDFDNTSGNWKKMPARVLTAYEIWEDGKPKDACVATIPESWVYDLIVNGPSPEVRFTK